MRRGLPTTLTILAILAVSAVAVAACSGPATPSSTATGPGTTTAPPTEAPPPAVPPSTSGGGGDGDADSPTLTGPAPRHAPPEAVASPAEPPTETPADTPREPDTPTSPPGPTVGLPSPSPLGAPPPVHGLIAIQNLREEIADLGRYRELLQRIHSGVEVPANLRTPPACTSALREEIATVIRQGHGNAYSVRRYREDLDELCGSFESWELPDERLLNRIGGFTARLGSIEDWMKDIRTCLDPGPYDGRCENAYGPAGGADAADAIAALALVEEARTALEGAPGGRFPCRHPLWARIEARRWTLRVARAQMPQVPREVMRICERIGVDAATVAARVRAIRDRISVDSANSRETEERLHMRVRNLQRTYGIRE